MPKYNSAKRLLIFIILFLKWEAGSSQIWVEFLSRDDSMAFLGSGSDNKVRIHNLPKKATVRVSGGAAIRVVDNDYVLCRFYSCLKKNAISELTILQNDSIIFSKDYKIQYTAPSGSIYNPQLYFRFRGSNQHLLSDNVEMGDTVTVSNFISALKKGFRLTSNYGKVIGFTITVLADSNLSLPWHIGSPHVVCGNSDFSKRSKKRKLSIMDHLRPIINPQDFKKGTKIFLDCVIVSSREGGFYSVAPESIYLK